ncbi:MAG: PqqD family protein [Acutalibacteraceae bacterium]
MKNKENYLDKIPHKKEGLAWSADENNIVTLEMENKGVVKKITQILIKKPKISYIHLDEIGSTVWQLIDGKKSITQIGEIAKELLGDKLEPLYERLSQYMKILENNGFIYFS